ncbi:MAG: RICIN domain-containing protein [Bacteroidota bacterium]
MVARLMLRIGGFSLFLVFLSLSTVSAQVDIPSGYVNLSDRYSDQVLELYYKYDGHFRMDAAEKDSYQWFTVRKLSNGFYKIATVRDDRYNVSDPGWDATELIRKSDNAADYYQQWEIKADPRYGWLTIRNRETGRCLEVTAEEAGAPATGIRMADCHGSSRQEFIFQKGFGRPEEARPNPNIRPAPPVTYSVSLTNKSMWTVSFRVATKQGWSAWKTFGSGKQTISGQGAITNYEIQWKDLATWKVYKGPTPIIPNTNRLNMTVTGNTLSPISVN